MNKIRLYDFLSFLLPGLLVSCGISFFFSYVVKLLPQGLRFQDLGALGNSIIFLVIAFLVGHVIQVFGNEFETRQIKYWGKRPLQTAKHPEQETKSGFSAAFISFLSNILPVLRFGPWMRGRMKAELGLIPNENGGGWYSRQLLRPEDNSYDSKTRESIRDAAQRILGVPFLKESDCVIQTDGAGKKQADRKNQMIFDRAYRFTLLKNIAPQTDDFNSQYGFYRGNCVAFILLRWIALISLIIFIIQFVSIWKRIDFSTACYQNYEHLISAVIAFLIFDALFFLFRRRFERFAFYFANSVYQNFLVWWLSEKNNWKKIQRK